MDALLEKDLLLGQTADAGSLKEETLDTTRSLVRTVSKDVPISKTKYLGFIHALANRIQETRRESVVTTRQLAVHEAWIGELDLKVCILTDD